MLIRCRHATVRTGSKWPERAHDRSSGVKHGATVTLFTLISWVQKEFPTSFLPLLKLNASNVLKYMQIFLWSCSLCKVIQPQTSFSKNRERNVRLVFRDLEGDKCPDKWQLLKSSVIPSAFCQQRIIFCLQVLPTGECHRGGAERHHRHAGQPKVREDGGGESGECQQGTVQYPGVCGDGGGRAGLHPLFYQWWGPVTVKGGGAPGGLMFCCWTGVILCMCSPSD